MLAQRIFKGAVDRVSGGARNSSGKFAIPGIITDADRDGRLGLLDDF